MSAAAHFTPARRRGIELLDDPAVDPAVALRSLADITRANRLLGGTAAVLAALTPHLARAASGANAARESPAPLTLVDVGTGAGDIPEAVRRRAATLGFRVETMGLEWTVPIAAAAAHASGPAAVGDARRLPFADRSCDIVVCSQVLHHFEDADARTIIGEMHRVARRCVVIGDLRRSWLAAAGLWLVSWPLGFHPVSRHDGVVSVMRGFSVDELGALVHGAIGRAPTVRRRPGFRVTADWAVA